MDDDTVTDPKENPANTGHLPVSGEMGVGPATYGMGDDDLGVDE